MKNSSGIDLSELTQAQRKMCVRLLAMNNVHFIQNNDNYVATLRVPTSELKNYIGNKKGSRAQHENQLKAGKKLNNKQIQNSKSKKKQREKSKDKQNNVSKLSTTVKKQTNKFRAGKKPLFKSVKLALISKIELIHPEVQIYVYPKKMPLIQLQEQIQQVYDQFWLANRSGILCDFHQCYYDIVCSQNGNLIKAKNDQSLVNSLQTINHFQHKQIGIKIFHLFLSQTYKNEQLSYFLVLRALLQELLGQKIVNQKYKSRPVLQTNIINKSNISIANTKPKLRWNPFEKQLSEFVCNNFLKIVVPKSNTIESTFEKLTQSMYYCEVKKGNYIRYYDLIDFMLKMFSQECQDVTATNLQLSYSNNDSTLNDIIAESGHRSTDRPLQTKFQLSLVNQSSLNVDDQPPEKQIFDNHSILTQQALSKAKEICRRLFLSVQVQNQILEKVYQCVESIINMDKIKWVQVLGLEGSEQEINFIEQIQIGYKNLCKQGNKVVMPKNLVKRMFVGPGFIKLFSKNVSF